MLPTNTEIKKGRFMVADGRKIAIGDVHGCGRELDRLLRELNMTDQDVCFSLGTWLIAGRNPGRWCSGTRTAGRALVNRKP